MNSIVDPKDFPGSQKYTYLNTANVALMYAGAEKAILEWQQDVALNGSFNFDETAEEAVSDGLHEPAARLFKAKPEDIAAGSSSTELLSTLAWAIMPGAGSTWSAAKSYFPPRFTPFSG